MYIDKIKKYEKYKLQNWVERLVSGIHEVGATEGGNKSPPCEVSDRLLATLEKVQNNIGGNTGQRSALRLWNTWINAIIGLNMDDMRRQPATKGHKMATSIGHKIAAGFSWEAPIAGVQGCPRNLRLQTFSMDGVMDGGYELMDGVV